MTTDAPTDSPATAEAIRDVDQAYVFHPWSVQSQASQLAVAGAQGCYFWDYDGKRYLDFSSQSVNVNIGHQPPHVVAAIQRQAERLCTFSPGVAIDVRSQAARLIAEHTPGDLNKIFFTNGGVEAVENAVCMARLHTRRHKVLSAYRSYHGSTTTAINLTGDPRRWPSDTGSAGVTHFWGPYRYRSEFHCETDEQECARALRHLEQVIAFEGPTLIAAVLLETVVGTAGVLVPPDGYLAGVREICDRHGIVFILDEVMSGFGRTGRWFAADHWGVVPDLLTFAKGVNSGYVPLGGVAVSSEIADSSSDVPYPGGLTYARHPLACASAVATIEAMRSEGAIENAAAIGRDVFAPGLRKLADRHPSVGEVRSLGVFWALELVRDRATREPLVPYNATGREAQPMAEFAAECKRQGLWPFVNMNRTHVAPPCIIKEVEVNEGLRYLDSALEVADRYCQTTR
ncbi:aspartate aminotransferase family protein [Streptomyces sp. NPDC014684]|uniref:aspartate aminotransferase family protein n=1 Tax=Streptomyces sp. NPDC014684 TaxID=3364880 RepID=UPI0036FF05F6